MKKIILGISVEGQTEAYFSKYVLARYLKKHNIQLLDPVIMGGNINLPRLESVISLMAPNYDYVTTLYDFYGFEGKSYNDNYNTLCEKIKTYGELAKLSNFLPYVQMYEFEALLFSDLNVLASHMDENIDKVQEYLTLLQVDIQNKAPETVNDSILTAPSKRIHNIFRRYKKSIYGYIIAQEIGISKIREKCPNFNSWINNIISLS
jgi:hypothetical protein